jgi:3-hydroxy-9,10-secoandrosta-1,3,5(10)-triene-9,17-dione monooxygenase reductase component
MADWGAGNESQSRDARVIVEPALTPTSFDPDPERFRQVLGHFCTGVTIITALDDGQPVGFSCQSFGALSLQPPLVLFCPARTSRTWPKIERSGYFCANILAAAQRELASLFGRSNPDRFAAVAWSPDTAGSPVIDGVLTWVGCQIREVHEAGDHFIVIGEVRELGDCHAGRPLLFYRGRYGTSARHMHEGPPEVVETLLAWPRHADWM